MLRHHPTSTAAATISRCSSAQKLSNSALWVDMPLKSAGAAEGEKDGVYIVYMGAATGSSKNGHAQLLSSVLKRRKNALVQSYEHGISGFAARLSAAEAQSIAKKPGVNMFAIIGILDTGISPESESFSGKDLGPIPSRWNGTCGDAHDFCNGKIIGARSYNSP
ncbi:CO(2)-RESPONSE SECRETED PROTEASE [Salix viminalis]|uniref:CO(2)-RESPONSE SECRETED PROTEASE n=1 Tax=Salix viminalis TaxID=40686 RepID=A0A9Q0ZE04_SALVM|nr:CO(2)-RESPONSE SECRETED PROTEASE [Salix viminalis]